MISAELLDHFSSKSGFPLRTTSPGFLVLRPTAGLRNPSRRPLRTRVPEMLDGAEGAKASAEPLDGEVLEPNFRPSAKHPPLDIGAVIADALRNAGLLKSG